MHLDEYGRMLGNLAPTSRSVPFSCLDLNSTIADSYNRTLNKDVQYPDVLKYRRKYTVYIVAMNDSVTRFYHVLVICVVMLAVTVVVALCLILSVMLVAMLAVTFVVVLIAMIVNTCCNLSSPCQTPTL